MHCILKHTPTGFIAYQGPAGWPPQPVGTHLFIFNFRSGATLPLMPSTLMKQAGMCLKSLLGAQYWASWRWGVPFGCLLTDDNDAVSLTENHLKYPDGLTQLPLLPPHLCIESHMAEVGVRADTGSRKAAVGSEASPPHPSPFMSPHAAAPTATSPCPKPHGQWLAEAGVYRPGVSA